MVKFATRFKKTSIEQCLLLHLWSTCEITSIIDYTLNYDKFGVLIEGKCKKCGNYVARLVEDE